MTRRGIELVCVRRRTYSKETLSSLTSLRHTSRLRRYGGQPTGYSARNTL